MLHSIEAALRHIDALITHTNPYKAGILYGIKKKLEDIKQSDDIDINKLDDLTSLCHDLLNNRQFTHKSVSLFGILTSKSEKFTHDLIILLKNTHLLAMEKIKQHHTYFDNYHKLLSSRDYLALFNKLCQIKEDTTCNTRTAARIAENWLIARLEERIYVPDTRMLKRYSALSYPALEINKHQCKLTIEKVIEMVAAARNNESASFTYAVDLNRNIIFSPGASTSYHYNLFHGADVYGAGEIYLRKFQERIYLDVVNNRSGLYKPGTELLPLIVMYFNQFSVNTAKTIIKDEAEIFEEFFLRHRSAY